jgi:hypothetical protein
MFWNEEPVVAVNYRHLENHCQRSPIQARAETVGMQDLDPMPLDMINQLPPGGSTPAPVRDLYDVRSADEVRESGTMGRVRGAGDVMFKGRTNRFDDRLDDCRSTAWVRARRNVHDSDHWLNPGLGAPTQIELRPKAG